MGSYSNLTWQLLVQFLLVLFLVVAVSGLAVGVGLIASSPKIVGYFHLLNRWVSTRHLLRPVEVPFDTERATHRHHRWLAAAFVLGGLVSVFGLFAGLDATAVGAAFATKRFAPVVAIAVESAKWALIGGSALGVVVGVMLLFYPNAESTLERFANKWVSSRRVTRSWDDMHMNLDALVEAHPRPAGWIIACTSAAAVICAVIMLARYY
jgi:drug/metabolite transporter (DMT)-like permease